MSYYLFVLASRHHRHLSVGVTSDLTAGIANHRHAVNQRLRKKRVLQKLVYVESISCVDDAVEREYLLRRISRARLVSLVETVNPGWDSISVRQLVAEGFNATKPRRN